jgi:NAD(P)-dependent dehydrogenase (short-subunit alcohol dehydrogenase family)
VAISYLPGEEADAKEVIALIEKEGRKAVANPGDIRSETFCKKLVAQAHRKLGGLDILELVAGKQHAVEKLADITTKQLEETYEVNVFALFWICKAALPIMLPGGSIITTASIQATHPSPSLLDYAPNKAALSLVRLHGRLPRAAFVLTALLRVRCGHRCKPAVVNGTRRYLRSDLRRR